MPRLVSLLVMLLYVAALTISVAGGPWYGYVAAPLLGFFAACFALAYPSDRSLRLILGAFAVFFLLLGGSTFFIEGFNWFAAREASFTLLIGTANLLCAVCSVVPGRCETGG